MADAIKNFAFGTVLTAPSPATSGTSLVLNSGQGANFAVGNAVCWPSGVQPLSSNAEIVRVTAVGNATLTSALTSGTAYTALAVTALLNAINSGDNVVLVSGTNTQTFVASAAAAIGATSISVTSLAANYSYPIGTVVDQDQLAITRAQEGTTAQSIAVGWQVSQDVTAGLMAQYLALSTVTTAGDLIVGSGASAVSRLGVGSNGQVLEVVSGSPAWTTPSAGISPVAGIISTANYAQPTLSTSNIVEVWGGLKGLFVVYDGTPMMVTANGVISLSSVINPASIYLEPASPTLPGTFTAATLPSSQTWQSVTYGNGKFVAVASGPSTAAAYSTDGINWTAATLPSSSNWYSVTYGNGKFVTVAYSSTAAAYSTDGINWTAATLPSSQTWLSVTYGNGKFVAVASGSTAAAYFALTIPKPTTFSVIPVDATTTY